MLLICLNCGYEKDIEDLNELQEDVSCPLCDSLLFYEGENEDIIQDETINRFAVYHRQQVKQDIERLGEEKTWQIIESIEDAQMRLQYRKLFFEVVREV